MAEQESPARRDLFIHREQQRPPALRGLDELGSLGAEPDAEVVEHSRGERAGVRGAFAAF